MLSALSLEHMKRKCSWFPNFGKIRQSDQSFRLITGSPTLAVVFVVEGNEGLDGYVAQSVDVRLDAAAHIVVVAHRGPVGRTFDRFARLRVETQYDLTTPVFYEAKKQ